MTSDNNDLYYPLDEYHFRTILETASEGILITNETGAILLINRRVEQMFGYDRQELIGKEIEILLPENIRSTHIRQRRGYVESPYSRSMGAGMELVGQHRDGKLIPVEVSLSYIRDAGGVLVLAFVTDITQRKQLEDEMQRTENLRLELEKKQEQVDFKQRLLSFVSHEFRTPLTRIQLSIEMLERYMDRIPAEKQRERIQSIQNEILELTQTLENMLALSKNWAGKLQYNPILVDIVAMCRKNYRQTQLLEGRHHRMVFHTKDVPPLVQCDPILLQPVISNLLSNAIKYSPKGSTIHQMLYCEANQIVLQIRDQGIGIPTEALPHLFDAFYRAKNSSEEKGAGLGLAITKDCVEAHDGTIECQSEIGKGTTFTVRLPLTTPPTTF